MLRNSGNRLRSSLGMARSHPAVIDPLGLPTHDTSLVTRGGSWNHDARACRSTARRSGWSGDRYDTQGFRLLRTVP